MGGIVTSLQDWEMAQEACEGEFYSNNGLARNIWQDILQFQTRML